MKRQILTSKFFSQVFKEVLADILKKADRQKGYKPINTNHSDTYSINYVDLKNYQIISLMHQRNF